MLTRLRLQRGRNYLESHFCSPLANRSDRVPQHHEFQKESAVWGDHHAEGTKVRPYLPITGLVVGGILRQGDHSLNRTSAARSVGSIDFFDSQIGYEATTMWPTKRRRRARLGKYWLYSLWD